MPSFVAQAWKDATVKGTANVTAAATWKVLLATGSVPTSTSTVSTSATSCLAANRVASGITEVANGGGYTTDGLSFAMTTTPGSGNVAVNAVPTTLSWTSATITATYAIIYRPSDGLPLAVLDFSGTNSSTAGTFSIVFSGSGVFSL